MEIKCDIETQIKNRARGTWNKCSGTYGDRSMPVTFRWMSSEPYSDQQWGRGVEPGQYRKNNKQRYYDKSNAELTVIGAIQIWYQKPTYYSNKSDTNTPYAYHSHYNIL